MPIYQTETEQSRPARRRGAFAPSLVFWSTVVSDAQIARTLVEAGADPGAIDDEYGTTPLVCANVGLDTHAESSGRRALVTYLEDITGASREDFVESMHAAGKITPIIQITDFLGRSDA